jgi:hypothetical protein
METTTQVGDAPLSVSSAGALLNTLLKGKDPEEKQEQTTPDNEAPAEGEETNTEASASESSETEAEATEEAEGQEAQESQDDSTNTPTETLTTLSDIGKKLGLDASLLYDIKVPVKVDGKDGEATLADVVRRYQTDAHLTHEGMKLADSKKEVQKQLESIETERNTRLGTLENAAQIVQTILLGESKNINWEQLKKDDPIGYLEKKDQFQGYQHSLAQIDAAIKGERQRDQQVQQEKYKAFIKEQQEKLVNAVPAWRDSAVQKKEYGELLDYLKTDFGVTKEEIDTIFDHRFYLMAMDSKKYRELQKKNPRVENKDRKPPVIAKSGNGKSSTAAKTVELKKQFTQKRDVKSAGAYLNSLIKKR